MAKDNQSWGWLAKLPVALVLAVASVIVFGGKLDWDRKLLTKQVSVLEAKQNAHVERITTMTEKFKGIDRRLERMEENQDRILDLMLKAAADNEGKRR